MLPSAYSALILFRFGTLLRLSITLVRANLNLPSLPRDVFTCPLGLAINQDATSQFTHAILSISALFEGSAKLNALKLAKDVGRAFRFRQIN
jgi:hypothetical protein